MSPADFSVNLFWDVNPQTLDFERHRKYVVGRVLERGTLDDWHVLCRALTLPGIVAVARTLRYLDSRAVAFLCAVGHVPRDSFRCCTSKPSTPLPWTS